jgi:sphingomyelin phosphodiesterase 2
LWHFFVSMVVSIAFLPVIIVVSYRAPWASILFYFFGCIVFATGLVNGMISFLFGRYELRNLQEVILEVNDRIHFLKYARG